MARVLKKEGEIECDSHINNNAYLNFIETELSGSQRDMWDEITAPRDQGSAVF